MTINLSIIHEMARFLLMNPSITAKELARKMGYAEEKSIYYWLNKAGFSGMKEFRRKVLSRQFPVEGVDSGDVSPRTVKDRDIKAQPSPVDALTPVTRESQKDYYSKTFFEVMRVPVYDGPEKITPGSNFAGYMKKVLTPRSYGIICKNPIGFLVEPGDLIIVDPCANPSPGDLFALNSGGLLMLARWYSLPDKSPIYVDAQDPSRIIDGNQEISGKVICIVKNLQHAAETR